MSAEGKLHETQNWYLIADLSICLNINIAIHSLFTLLTSKHPRLFPKTSDNILLS